MGNDDSAPADKALELARLVATLHETHERIQALAGDTVDTVLHQSGKTYLLPKAQADLRQSESYLRRFSTERAAILDSLPAHIAMLDADGTILTVNHGWKRFAEEHDYAGDDNTIGQNYLTVCQTATGPEADDARLAAEGIRAVLDGTRETFALQYPCHSPTEKQWFTMAVTPVVEEDRRRAVVMHFDITRRVLADERARELQTRLERIIDHANVGILVERDGRPLLANPELARMLGYPSADAVMALDTSLLLFAEDERDRLAGFGAARLAGRQAPGAYRVRGRRQSGVEIMLEARAFIVRWGDSDAICTMVHDITEQLENEEKIRQSQKLQAIGQLTGGIAHDFNNLLTVVMGNAEILEDMTDADLRVRKIGQITRRAAENGAELTRRLLAFARKQPLDPRPTDINLLITGMDTLLRRTLGAPIAIEFVRATGLWPALIDPSQLENAVLNICLNARDAMPEGGKLTLELANVHLDRSYADWNDDVEPGHYVLIAISDNGLGIPEDLISRVIEPFFTTKKTGEGTGLGLSMVYGFVKQSGGHLKLYSEPGHGTTVKIYLPRAPLDGSTMTPDQTGDQASQGTETILVVEDDDAVRQYVTTQLETLGYRAISASNGADALALLKSGVAADMLFTDIVLPGGMNGRQLADAAHAIQPDLPVLFTSGYTENAVIHHGRLDPGVELLNKPYRRQELARKVRKVLDRA